MCYKISLQPLKTLHLLTTTHRFIPHHIISVQGLFRTLAREKTRAQIVRWTIVLCRPKRERRQENTITSNNKIQSDDWKLRYAQISSLIFIFSLNVKTLFFNILKQKKQKKTDSPASLRTPANP